jgi:hypothetical protein
MKQPMFSIDCRLKLQADLILKSLKKDHCFLEGVMDFGNGTFNIYWFNNDTKLIENKICRINYNIWDNKKIKTTHKHCVPAPKKVIPDINNEFFEIGK